MWQINNQTTTGETVINTYHCSCGENYLSFKKNDNTHTELCGCGNQRETPYIWVNADKYEHQLTLTDEQLLAIAIIKEDYEEAHKIHNKIKTNEAI